MNNDVHADVSDIKNLVESMDFETLKTLQKEAKRKISNIKVQNRIKFCIYLPAEQLQNFDAVLDWAYQHRFISKKSKWAFVKHCVIHRMLVISKIMFHESEEQYKLKEKELALQNEELVQRNANIVNQNLG